LLPRTIVTQDNCYPGQWIPWTVVTLHNCYQGQLLHRTVVAQDNCYPGQLLPRKTVTQDKCYPGYHGLEKNNQLQTKDPMREIVFVSTSRIFLMVRRHFLYRFFLSFWCFCLIIIDLKIVSLEIFIWLNHPQMINGAQKYL